MLTMSVLIYNTYTVGIEMTKAMLMTFVELTEI